MYRIQQQLQTQDTASLEFRINHDNHSSQAGGGVLIPLPHVPVNCGPLSLQRHRQFKHENLVPVMPTRYVLISIPPIVDAGVLGEGVDQQLAQEEGDEEEDEGNNSKRGEAMWRRRRSNSTSPSSGLPRTGSGSAPGSASKRGDVRRSGGGGGHPIPEEEEEQYDDDVLEEVTMHRSPSTTGSAFGAAPGSCRSGSGASPALHHHHLHPLPPSVTQQSHYREPSVATLPLLPPTSTPFATSTTSCGSIHHDDGCHMHRRLNVLGVEALLSTALDTVGIPQDVQLFVDPSGSSSGGATTCFLLLEMVNGDDALDVLYNINVEMQLPFDVELCGQRRAVAFPCDPRPDYEKSGGDGGGGGGSNGSSPLLSSSASALAVRSSSSSATFMDIPCCMLCCDRLEKAISGMHHRSVCCCPPESCQCLMMSDCVVCKTVTPRSAGDASYTGAVEGSYFSGGGGGGGGLASSSSVAVPPPMPLRVMPRCDYCGAADDTWMCLVCAHVGCSRYHSQHAKLHHAESGHEFAIAVRTQQIWDYKDDTFVHRLLTSYYSGCRRLELGRPGGSNIGGGTTGSSHSSSFGTTHFGAGGENQKMAAATPYKNNSSSSTSTPTAGYTPGGGGGGMPLRQYSGSQLKSTAEPSQLQPAASGFTTKTVVDAKFDAKVEGICRDFTHTLTQQLEQQRTHYEAMIRQAQEMLSKETEAADSATALVTARRPPPPPRSTAGAATPPPPPPPIPTTTAPASAASASSAIDASTTMHYYTVFNSLHSDLYSIGTTVRACVAEDEKFNTLVKELKSRTVEESRLLEETDALKAETRKLLEESTALNLQIKKRIPELKEEIAEAKANLRAMQQIQEGLNGEDPNKAMTFVEKKQTVLNTGALLPPSPPPAQRVSGGGKKAKKQ